MRKSKVKSLSERGVLEPMSGRTGTGILVLVDSSPEPPSCVCDHKDVSPRRRRVSPQSSPGLPMGHYTEVGGSRHQGLSTMSVS